MRASWATTPTPSKPILWSLPVSKQALPLEDAYLALHATFSALECAEMPSLIPSPLSSALLAELGQPPRTEAEMLLFFCCPVEDSASLDLIGWLCAYDADCRVFWSDRERSLICAGLGVALQLSGEQPEPVLQKVRSFLCDAPPTLRFFGGQAFDLERPLPSAWSAFSPVQWTLPRVMLTKEGGQYSLALALALAPDTDRIKQIAVQRRLIDEEGLLSPPRSCVPPAFSAYRAISRQDTPILPLWKDTIKRAKDSFAQGSLEKIVLARQTTLRLRSQCPSQHNEASHPLHNEASHPLHNEASHPLHNEVSHPLHNEASHPLHNEAASCAACEPTSDVVLSDSNAPFALLAALRAQAADSYVFAFQPTRHTVFLGASPERLYARQGELLFSEALAGTRPRRSDPTQDQRLGEELLASPKDRYEQLLVLRSLRERFGLLCHALAEIPAPALRKLKYVQHLWTPIQGHLHAEVDDTSILRALHPTPAVGGRPSVMALSLLREFERFGRGWYAAPVGWMGAQGAEFAVAIRSALLAQEQLLLFTGAGIVPDSDAETEWQELEQKLKTFWEFVDCAPDPMPPTKTDPMPSIETDLMPPISTPCGPRSL
ncbi:isochorismate synthase [Myxococcota bacterium]|nr:isochorismate synthase [Myxococcota bacterium]